DQAKYIGWQGAFYNFAKILANGALVFLAGTLKDSFGPVYAWMIIMLICSGILIFAALYHARVLPTKNQTTSEVKSSAEAMTKLWEVLTSFFQKKYIWIYIVFIILYRFAEGFAMKIVPLFLKASVAKGGLGLSIQDIGIVYGTAGSAAFIIGSILGGYFIASRGLKRSIFILCCIFNIPFVVYFLLAMYQPESIYVIGAAIFGEYFGYGFGFVGLMLFMMQQVAPGKHQMAHYAFASGIMNLGVMIPGLVSGYLSDSIGYHDFFIVVLVATIPAFLATWFVPFTYPDPIRQKK
ncbi:MAG: MFS transporter, partial [Bacteroidaceae bacterium]